MKLEVIISLIIGALGVLVAALALIKSNKSDKKTQEQQDKYLELQKKNIELKETLLALDRDTKRKQILDQTVNKNNKEILKNNHTQQYCKHISDKFRYLDFTGLNAILQKPLLLEDIYVKLRAKPAFERDHYRSIEDFKQLALEKAADHSDDDRKSKDPGRDFVTVFRKLKKESEKKEEALKAVILGHPGSGKTTLMKWIALQCACAGKTSPFAGLLPVFIHLKDLGREPDLFLKKSIRQLTKDRFNERDIPASFLDECFETNRLLFLLDGLDEVAEEDVRRKVIAWIQGLNVRKNGILITSRFSGLQPARGLTFHDSIPVFQILDFEIEDIEHFLENWYKNIEVAVAGNANDEEKAKAIEKGKSRYDDLIETIKSGSYENLKKLAVNPLLLTIIAIVHRTRAVLPRERHKLYEECLKVMIELWNIANRKIDISFSVENSIANLSKLAVELMKEDRRELDLKEIQSLLPEKIEGHSLTFFLEEMVLKAGLLYLSEGGYGFLHLTFQEYLAAWYFAKSPDQNGILQYCDKDYWYETFKLFVNIANASQFFNEIIDHLEEKEYWRHMQLWDDCMEGIVLEDTQHAIEMAFASKVLDILPTIEYKEENEPLIMQLYAHYPLYSASHAPALADQGWRVFKEARHPFVRSIGTSVLNKAGEEHQARLMEELKQAVRAFEKNKNKTPQQLLDFLYRYHNAFVLLIAARRNLMDFNFALATLKSEDFFVVFLDLRYLRYLRYLLDLRDLLDLLDLRDLRDLLDLRDLRDLLDLRYLLDLLDLRDLRDLRYFKTFQETQDQFIHTYRAVIEKNAVKIHLWVDQAREKLNDLTDEKLLEYFPNTSAEEIKQFRENW